MKIKYRKPTPSGYSARAARAEAKKVLLAELAAKLRAAAACGYEETAVADAEVFAAEISHWPNYQWQAGAKQQLNAAVHELIAEFERRAAR